MPGEPINMDLSGPGPRMVMCVKIGRLLPGLPKPPFKGAMGERIFNEVSATAWEMWQEQQTLLINHYGLSLGDSRAHAFLQEQMEAFFFSDEARMPEGWTPPTGGQKGKGASPRK